MKKLLVALVLLGLICFALCDDAAAKKPSKSKSNKGNGGPCEGGFWPDGKGCCPKKIGKHGFLYRDNHGCYPNSNGKYADATGCYPNSKGVYRAAGAKCSKSDICCPECIRPHSKSHSKSNSKSHKSNSKSHKSNSKSHKSNSKSHSKSHKSNSKSCSKSRSRSRSHSRSQSRCNPKPHC